MSTTFAERGGQPRSLSTIFKALEIAADVGQEAREFRTDGVEGARESPARVDRHLGDGAGVGAAARGVDRSLPIRGHALQELRLLDVAAEALAGFELRGVEKGSPVAILSPREPGERAFRFIDERRTRGLFELAQRIGCVLGAKRLRLIDVRRGQSAQMRAAGVGERQPPLAAFAAPIGRALRRARRRRRPPQIARAPR